MSENVQTCPELFKLVLGCSNLSENFQTCPEVIQISQNLFKLVNLFLKWFKLVSNCSNLGLPDFLVTNVDHCTEVRFASFPSGGFINAIVVNPPERKLAKCSSVQSSDKIDANGPLPIIVANTYMQTNIS